MDPRVPNKGLKKATDVPRPRISTLPTKTGASISRYSNTPAKTTKHGQTEKTEQGKNPSVAARSAQTMRTPTTKAEKSDKTVNGPGANSKSTTKTAGTKNKNTMTDSVPSTRETYLNSTKVPSKAEKTVNASVANSKSTGKTGGMSTRKSSTMTDSNLSTANTYLNSKGKDLKPKKSITATGYGYTGQETSQGGAIKPEKAESEVKRDRLIKFLRYFAYT